MEIPNGFLLDPSSGLYYSETMEIDPNTGRQVRIVTWLNVQSGESQQVSYPVKQEQPPVAEEEPASQQILYGIPEGFESYPNSELYYRSELVYDEQTYITVQRVVYFNPVDGTYEMVDYPVETTPETNVEAPSQFPIEPNPYVEEAVASQAYIQQEEIPAIPLEQPPEVAFNEVSTISKGEAPAVTAQETPTAVNEESSTIPVQETPTATNEETSTIPVQETLTATYNEETPVVESTLPPPIPQKPQDFVPQQQEPLKAAEELQVELPNEWQQPQPQQYDFVPPPPPPITPEEYVPQESFSSEPPPRKRSKAPMIAAICGVLVIAAVGVCIWKFDLLAGLFKSTTTQGDASNVVDQINIYGNLPISVTVEHFSGWDANITISGIPFRDRYPASIEGKEENVMLYRWGVEFGEYEVSLLYFAKDENDTGTISFEDMQCNLWKKNADGTANNIADVQYEISGDSITFLHVTLSPNDAVDFTNSKTKLTVQLNEIDAWFEKEINPTLIRAQSEETPNTMLETSYKYIDSATQMQAVLSFFPEETFEFSIDFGGNTYLIKGQYIIGTNEEILLESDDAAPPYIWDGSALFTMLSDGSLLLESPSQIGVLASGMLMKPTEIVDFPYAGQFECTDSALEKEYRPSIFLSADRTFTMIINTGNGMVTGTGTFVWDMQPGMFYLKFIEINGEDVVSELSQAEVKIISENELHFLTEGFGLMGYGDKSGIFTRK